MLPINRDTAVHAFKDIKPNVLGHLGEGRVVVIAVLNPRFGNLTSLLDDPVADDRLVFIDLPQVVDLVANPRGADLLLRDCTNVVAWFRRRGLEVDEQEVYAEVLAAAW